MLLRALSLFQESGIIVYALTVHTSGKTQPLDVALFGRCTLSRYKTTYSCTTASVIDTFNTFDFCKMVRRTYNETFICPNIIENFE